MTDVPARDEPSAPSAPAPFGVRLHAAATACGPVCVGVDPHPGLLRAWDLPERADGVERFGRTVVEALAGRIAALKPQVAFFERFGSEGFAALERVLEDARQAGLLTIVDAKRGDIGSTMAAYAQAYAGDGSPLAGDAVTASPYLGFEALRPLLDLARDTGRGVFVLALTSNPEGAAVQAARAPDGRTVAGAVLDAVAAENAAAVAAGRPWGSVGAVVGATVGAAGRDHDLARIGGPLLAPGIGAQGAGAADLAATFGNALPLVLASSSRGVLAGGPSLAGLREAADRTREVVLAAVGAARPGTAPGTVSGRLSAADV